ncbi:hypothetical protein LAZ67_3000164 [Cordylochernes scorpioides]|uniref:Reverse transcriptase domain-containing protein n=1 Tax=Cordylochernes scorpioides TaxID=51811 RepID=A0ABY6K661_9ARAC|nr:hypothetical protein LAZ67_3000164 [Cordylochernes scorpioides]
MDSNKDGSQRTWEMEEVEEKRTTDPSLPFLDQRKMKTARPAPTDPTEDRPECQEATDKMHPQTSPNPGTNKKLHPLDYLIPLYVPSNSTPWATTHHHVFHILFADFAQEGEDIPVAVAQRSSVVDCRQAVRTSQQEIMIGRCEDAANNTYPAVGQTPGQRRQWCRAGSHRRRRNEDHLAVPGVCQHVARERLAFISEGHSPIRHLRMHPVAVSFAEGVNCLTYMIEDIEREPLSPYLFILFVTDLINIFNDSTLPGIYLPNFGTVHLLMYADDIILIGESKINLQIKINMLKKYFETNHLTLNESKSKIMVFRNGGRPAKSDKWFWGDQLLTVTSKYLYLGYPLTTTISFSQVASYFKGKALAATGEVWKIMEKSRLNSFGSSMKLLDSIILSTLLYSAPIWANEKYKILDQIQNNYLRQLLNLPSNTPGYILRMETGRFSLGVTATKLILKFWLRILKMEKSRLPAICLAQLWETSTLTNTFIGFTENLMIILNSTGFIRTPLRIVWFDVTFRPEVRRRSTQHVLLPCRGIASEQTSAQLLGVRWTDKRTNLSILHESNPGRSLESQIYVNKDCPTSDI